MCGFMGWKKLEHRIEKYSNNLSVSRSKWNIQIMIPWLELDLYLSKIFGELYSLVCVCDLIFRPEKTFRRKCSEFVTMTWLTIPNSSDFMTTFSSCSVLFSSFFSSEKIIINSFKQLQCCIRENRSVELRSSNTELWSKKYTKHMHLAWTAL